MTKEDVSEAVKGDDALGWTSSHRRPVIYQVASAPMPSDCGESPSTHISTCGGFDAKLFVVCVEGRTYPLLHLDSHEQSESTCVSVLQCFTTVLHIVKRFGFTVSLLSSSPSTLSEFSFFDPSDPQCREVLLDPRTTISELFAVLRQWVPQVQKNIYRIGNEVLPSVIICASMRLYCCRTNPTGFYVLKTHKSNHFHYL